MRSQAKGDMSFREACCRLKPSHARSCFIRAIMFNKIAHAVHSRGKRTAFKMKTRCLERAIQLAPEAIFMDSFQSRCDGLVGFTFPGVGRLHVRFDALDGHTREFVWDEIVRQYSPDRRSVA